MKHVRISWNVRETGGPKKLVIHDTSLTEVMADTFYSRKPDTPEKGTWENGGLLEKVSKPPK